MISLKFIKIVNYIKNIVKKSLNDLMWGGLAAISLTVVVGIFVSIVFFVPMLTMYLLYPFLGALSLILGMVLAMFIVVVLLNIGGVD